MTRVAAARSIAQHQPTGPRRPKNAPYEPRPSDATNVRVSRPAEHKTALPVALGISSVRNPD